MATAALQSAVRYPAACAICLLRSVGLIVQNLDHALRVKNNATRGGLLENFYFRDIEVGQVAHAVIHDRLQL
jgi:hypothetical protein